MNIKDATKHIKATIEAYLEKDELGDFVIPVEKQRPVFLYGPPGIGKTAVVEQIAEELGIGIVSYSMTHHTRQSALGLPYIKTLKFGDTEIQVSEYTMSEILASVYGYIEETGKEKGILFLDEINCVSETLSPAMLRFLQYKSFGSHKVPDGWVVVTAGNPPEYNKSVREYDIATLDRVQKIDVEPGYDVWREYAVKRNVHPTIVSFLDVNRQSFYFIENTPVRKEFVTARGWEDLSRLMYSFESRGVSITRDLIEQYIQAESIAGDFYEYYQVFERVKNVFCVEAVLNGDSNAQALSELKKAPISEKIGFINHLSVCLFNMAGDAVSLSNALKIIAQLLKKDGLTDGTCNDVAQRLKKLINEKNLSSSKADNQRALKLLEELVAEFEKSTGQGSFCVSQFTKNQLEKLKASVSSVQKQLSCSASFLFDAFADSPEFKIFVSNIITNSNTAAFLIAFGCDGFSKYVNNEYDSKEILNDLKLHFDTAEK